MKCFRIFILAVTVVLAAGCFGDRATDFRLMSPDGTLVVTVVASDSLNWSVSRHGVPLLDRSTIGLCFADGFTLGQGVRIGKVQRRHIERTVKAPFYRQAEFEDRCNELRIELGNDCAVTFRAYDEGCAYRFETGFEDDRIVRDEIVEFNFSGSPALQAAFSDGLCNAFQFPYTYCRADTLPTDKLIILPLAADCGEAGRVLVCESDLEAYPGMFLVSHEGGLRGRFACVPDSCYLHEQRCQKKVVTRQDFIARVSGTRSYPWRILAVADEDRELPVNNLVYALAAENKIGDCSWVRPGKVAWEWWNNWGLDNTDFEPGVNTRTYKAYIDFAADYGLEYVVLDEGWYDPRSGDVMRTIPEIDLPELIRYADSKGVGLMLWVVGNVLDDRLEEACDYYAKLGIKGFKVDFIDRDDQQAVELVYRLAEATAAQQLMLDIHGIYKPTGLNRTFPHIVNFEGVYGLEELKWSNPDMPSYNVTFPFIRMAQGPVDYTPGAYRNATRDGFKIDYRNPMSQGTRAHQVAAYIVFDAPLVMLCDSPSHYRADDDCTRFIVSLPVICDHTEVLSGEMGQYIVTARRNGETWYVGGLTNWTPRELEIDLSFLDAGCHYEATLLADARDADIKPEKYTLVRQSADSTTQLKIAMAPGGGFALKLSPKSENH